VKISRCRRKRAEGVGQFWNRTENSVLCKAIKSSGLLLGLTPSLLVTVYHSLFGGHIIYLVRKVVLSVCHVKISQTSLHSRYIGMPEMTEGALRCFCKCFRPAVQKSLNNDQFLSKEIEPDQN